MKSYYTLKPQFLQGTLFTITTPTPSSLYKIISHPLLLGDLHAAHHGCRPWIAILCWSQINLIFAGEITGYLFKAEILVTHVGIQRRSLMIPRLLSKQIQYPQKSPLSSLLFLPTLKFESMSFSWIWASILFASEAFLALLEIYFKALSFSGWVVCLWVLGWHFHLTFWIRLFLWATLAFSPILFGTELFPYLELVSLQSNFQTTVLWNCAGPVFSLTPSGAGSSLELWWSIYDLIPFRAGLFFGTILIVGIVLILHSVHLNETRLFYWGWLVVILQAVWDLQAV